MGVMLVSGGCAADMLAPNPAPAPETLSLPEVLARRATHIRMEAPGARPASGRIVRRCEMVGKPMAGRPLMIVNGEEIAHGQFSGFDPEFIEDIEVLDGPRAVAIYGQRAVDGAIVIQMIRL